VTNKKEQGKFQCRGGGGIGQGGLGETTEKEDTPGLCHIKQKKGENLKPTLKAQDYGKAPEKTVIRKLKGFRASSTGRKNRGGQMLHFSRVGSGNHRFLDRWEQPKSLFSWGANRASTDTRLTLKLSRV